jgi:hypothetical protein
VATRLKNILQFLAVPPGVPTVLPHGLNFGTRPVIPDLAIPSVAGFTVGANVTNVTVINNGPVAADIDVYVEAWHTIERDFGAAATVVLSPQPFVPNFTGVAGSDTYSPPEAWAVQNIGAATPPTPMSALVSTSFDEIEAIQAGSITGMNARLTEVLTAGDILVTVTINGVPGTLAVAGGIGFTSGRTTQAAGIDVFAAGDLIGVQYETGIGTTPVNADLEAWIEFGQ